MNNRSNQTAGPDVSLSEMQRLIREMYHEKDVARGATGTFLWLVEEIGELAASVREQDGSPEKHAELSAEFADVLAWLATIANVTNVDLADAVNRKYGSGCPGCNQFACVCPDDEKP